MSAKTATISLLLFCGFLSASFAEEPNKTASVFGSTVKSESALIGILYDLKQTQKHEPTKMTPGKYLDIVAQFVDSDWDESVLNHYYRVSKPVYTTEIFIPYINADIAPKAFGVEKLVMPKMWLVHYKGQVSAPEDGTYRFLGDADDVMAVAVNSKTVLVAYFPGLTVHSKWFPKEASGIKWKNKAEYFAGDWFEVKKGKPIDLDIIIGECPGGLFHSAIAIQKKGVVYSMDKSKNPQVPPFQLSFTELTSNYPEAKIWKGWQ